MSHIAYITAVSLAAELCRKPDASDRREVRDTHRVRRTRNAPFTVCLPACVSTYFDLQFEFQLLPAWQDPRVVVVGLKSIENSQAVVHEAREEPRFLHCHQYPSTCTSIVSTMKSWNEASGEHAPLIAPPRCCNAGAGGVRARWRALGLSVATCMAIFGLEALFPYVKNWGLSTWRGENEADNRGRPFEWSQVRFKIWYSCRALGDYEGACIF